MEDFHLLIYWTTTTASEARSFSHYFEASKACEKKSKRAEKDQQTSLWEKTPYPHSLKEYIRELCLSNEDINNILLPNRGCDFFAPSTWALILSLKKRSMSSWIHLKQRLTALGNI